MGRARPPLLRRLPDVPLRFDRRWRSRRAPGWARHAVAAAIRARRRPRPRPARHAGGPSCGSGMAQPGQSAAGTRPGQGVGAKELRQAHALVDGDAPHAARNRRLLRRVAVRSRNPGRARARAGRSGGGYAPWRPGSAPEAGLAGQDSRTTPRSQRQPSGSNARPRRQRRGPRDRRSGRTPGAARGPPASTAPRHPGRSRADSPAASPSPFELPRGSPGLARTKTEAVEGRTRRVPFAPTRPRLGRGTAEVRIMEMPLPLTPRAAQGCVASAPACCAGALVPPGASGGRTAFREWSADDEWA